MLFFFIYYYFFFNGVLNWKIIIIFISMSFMENMFDAIMLEWFYYKIIDSNYIIPIPIEDDFEEMLLNIF